jgi:hypothetical protein
MGAIPQFETVAIVGDKPSLVAEIASLFTRPRRYLPVLDGPRMARADWDNEVIRRSNALLKAQSRRVVLADLPSEPAQHLSQYWPEGTCISVTSADEAAAALKSWVKAPRERIVWGSENLGVGLLLARRSKKFLRIAEGASPTTNFVSGGLHLLIVCEMGNELAQVAASNLAFATDAAFLMLPQLGKEEQDEWLEEIYAIDSGGDVSSRFSFIRDRVRHKLPDFQFRDYKQILFVTNGFPWGIAVPECATTHMFSYPDFGRSIVEGIWASQQPSCGARNALLIHPQQVAGSEIETIANLLGKNGTLVRLQAGPQATVNKVQMLVETLPFDIIVLSTHVGDIPGERATYEFKDSEGLSRRLVIDHAVGFGYDPKTSKVLVQQFERFHELDAVDWTDSAAKKNLYVGTAIQSWLDLGDIHERSKFKVYSETIPRVIGSMGLQLHDHIWIPMIQGFPPSCSPMVINNGCSSWHELSKRFTFAGARAYVGTLFPVTEAEAQEVGALIFKQEFGVFMPTQLWVSQNAVYGNQDRRPYAMVGLPFCSIQPNTINSVSYLEKEYRKAIAEYGRKEETSPFPEIKENSQRFKDFLSDDFQAFKRRFQGVGGVGSLF